jgi:hypothetical protein
MAPFLSAWTFCGDGFVWFRLLRTARCADVAPRDGVSTFAPLTLHLGTFGEALPWPVTKRLVAAHDIAV